MRKDWKYILYISIAFSLYVLVKMMSPAAYNWTITFAHEDKNPFGAYALDKLLPSFFTQKKITHSYKTLYELKDTLHSQENIFIITQTFDPSKEDTKTLLKHVEDGGNAFIAAQNFSGKFSDTLHLNVGDVLFQSGFSLDQKDTATLHFVNPRMDTTKQFYFRRDNTHNYFSNFDSVRTTVVAKNDRYLPVTIRIPRGKGVFILNSTPLAFTNIYLLHKENYAFASTTFSYLPQREVRWTEFYHLGRRELQTPLRYILTNEPLSWAYYLIVISILIFMFFEAKRKQRIIPIVKPLANSTLEFVSTIGNLYYQNGDHKNIAEKKINFFWEQIRTNYWMNTNRRDEQFIVSLAKKSGHSEEEVNSLVKLIFTIQSKKWIDASELTELNNKLEKFNRQA